MQAYRTATGNPEAKPDEFEAYGYDAGLLLLTLMDRYHVSTREDLPRPCLTWRLSPEPPEIFTFNSDGEYQIEPTLLTVEGNEFQQIK